MDEIENLNREVFEDWVKYYFYAPEEITMYRRKHDGILFSKRELKHLHNRAYKKSKLN